MDERKSKNYIPVGINAGGIIIIIAGTFKSGQKYVAQSVQGGPVVFQRCPPLHNTNMRCQNALKRICELSV